MTLQQILALKPHLENLQPLVAAARLLREAPSIASIYRNKQKRLTYHDAKK